MSFVEQTERPAPTNVQIPQRHAVYVHAIVGGLGPTLIPLYIRDVSRRGMYLAFQGHAAAVDEQWVGIGAAIMIVFKATIDGHRQPVKVQAEIRRRDENGIGVRLVTRDESVLAALRSLVIDAMANRGKWAQVPTQSAMPQDSPPKNNLPEKALTECEALLQKLGPPVIAAYMSGIEASLWNAKSAAPLSAQRKIGNIIEPFEKARQRIEQITQAQLTAAFGEYHRGKQIDNRDETSKNTGGLSLVESSELRVSFAIVEAVDRIGARLAGSWFELKQRLAQVTLRTVESSPISPGAVCFRLRNALFDDPRLGALRQIDLTDGFTDEFARRLDALYRDMAALLSHLGLSPMPVKTTASPKNIGRLIPGK